MGVLDIFSGEKSLLILPVVLLLRVVDLRRVIRESMKGYVLVSSVVIVHFILCASSCGYEILLKFIVKY